MIHGASGKTAKIELTDYEAGVLFKVIDIANEDQQLRDRLDSDDYMALSALLVKLGAVF